MQFKKHILLLLSFMMLAGAGLFSTACGKKSDTEKASEAMEDAAKSAKDTLKEVSQ